MQLQESAGKPKGGGRRGSSIIEFSLLLPWYVFLFVGAYDYGFFSYSLIATQTAASVGANYCASNSTTTTDATTACGYALDQLRNMPNVGYSMTNCGSGSTVTATVPLAVTASSVTGPDGYPAASVTVTFLTPQLIPIPGLLPGQLTISRTVKMPVRG